jgi:hypothetical protein
MIQHKFYIEEFLEDAKREWKDNYQKYYYPIVAGQEFEEVGPEEEQRRSRIFDRIMAGWIQGVIDTLEWVLDIPENEQTLTDMHMLPKYRLKLEKFRDELAKQQ